MRKYIFIIAICLVSNIQAQDYYKELFDALPTLSPHEAVYQLSDYQASYPHFAGVYYQLGKYSEQIAATEHPIRDYSEVMLCLYNVKLYYGNCLHYAQNQSQKSIYYAEVPLAGKKLTYEDLERYLQPRISMAEEQSKNVRQLYEAYNTLISRYDNCRTLFTAFSQKFNREKNAHLYFTQDDEQQLRNLKAEAETLNTDIQTFQSALSAYPIAGYNPEFHFTPIVLYRLDGLSTTNFLQDEVTLWDYAGWVEHFLSEQDDMYQPYYTRLEQSHLHTQSAISGSNATYEPDRVLLNLTDRFNYHSFMLYFLHLEQEVATAAVEARDTLLYTSTPYSTDQWERAFDILYTLRKHQMNIRQDTTEMRKQYSEDEARKYASFLQSYYPETLYPDPLPLMQQYDSITLAASSRLLQYADTAVSTDIERYTLTNDMTGEIFRAKQSADELTLNRLSDHKKVLATAEVPLTGSLFGMVQMEDKYLVFVSFSQLFSRESTQQEIASLLIGQNGEILKINYYNSLQRGIVICKLTGNLVAVLSKNDNGGNVFFVDKQGNIIM